MKSPFFCIKLVRGGGEHPCPQVSYATTHSRKVPPPKPRVKAKSSLSGRNYFITMHHQAGVHFENYTEVKFRDSPRQTYGRSNLNQNLKPESNFRFIREKHLLLLLLTKSASQGHLPPLVGSLLSVSSKL